MSAEPESIDTLRRRLDAAPRSEPSAGHIDDAQLAAYAAQTLDEDAAAAVEAHLTACRACRDLLLFQVEDAPSGLRDWAIEQVQRRPPARRARWTGIAVGLALAAALAFFVMPGRSLDPLPGYIVDDLTRYPSEQRHDNRVASGEVLPATQLKLRLRPEGASSGSVHAVALGAHNGETLVALSGATISPRDDGAFVVTGTAGGLFGDRVGRWTIHLVVAAERADIEGLDGRSEAEARAAATDSRWASVTVEYRAD